MSACTRPGPLAQPWGRAEESDACPARLVYLSYIPPSPPPHLQCIQARSLPLLPPTSQVGCFVEFEELMAAVNCHMVDLDLPLLPPPSQVSCFVEFEELMAAVNCHSNLQGAVLASSDRGGIRVQFSKNPYGMRWVTGEGGGSCLHRSGPCLHYVFPERVGSGLHLQWFNPGDKLPLCWMCMIQTNNLPLCVPPT